MVSSKTIGLHVADHVIAKNKDCAYLRTVERGGRRE